MSLVVTQERGVTLPGVTSRQASNPENPPQTYDQEGETSKSVVHTVHTVQGQSRDNPETVNTDQTEKTGSAPSFEKKRRSYSPQGRIRPCDLIQGLLKSRDPNKGGRDRLNKFLFEVVREVALIERNTGNLYSMELLVEQWWPLLDRFEDEGKRGWFFQSEDFSLVDELERLYEYVEAKPNQANMAYEIASKAWKAGQEHSLVSECFPGKSRKKHKLLCLFCRELARLSCNGGVFYLGNALASKVLGQENSSYGNRAIKTLIRYGIIEEVSKGCQESKQASSYRYLLSDFSPETMLEAAKESAKTMFKEGGHDAN